MKKVNFELPDTLKNSEDAEALKAVGQTIADGVSASVESQIEEGLKNIRENGIGKDIMDKLETQGSALTKLQESIGSPAKVATMEQKFYESFDKVVAALKGHGQPVTIKAIDEHNPALIHTTDNAITAEGGATTLETVRDAGLYEKRRGRSFVRDIANVVNVGSITSEAVTFTEEGDGSGSFAIVTENGLKPQVFFTLVKKLVEGKKVAGYVVATEELMRHKRRAWAAIQRMFRNQLERDFDALLVADINGVSSQYVSSALDGQITNPGNLHAIIAAMAQVSSLNFIPDMLVMNPQDAYLMIGADATPNNSSYLFLPMYANGGEVRPAGLNLILSTLVPQGTFYVGESGLFEVEVSSDELRVGYVNDDLIHNRQTFVLERWLLDWLPTPLTGSWVHGNFADIKEALNKPDA